MDIVFIHGNYPGQFRHLAPCLANLREHRVIFLTEKEDIESGKHGNIEIRKFKQHREPSNTSHQYLTTSEEAIIKGQAILRELDNLKKDGINPRVVITHAGMGLGLFVKDIVPDALHIGLFEWYFQEETTSWLIEDYNLDTKLRTRFRNMPIVEEIMRCDVGVVPTDWQKKQFPKIFQDKLEIIFDGIDCNFFNKDEKIKDQTLKLRGELNKEDIKIESSMKVMSYATRGMETLRGFPEFMRVASKCLEEDPNLLVIIAGRDRCAYSYQPRSHGGSWKRKLLDELGEFKGKERMIFTGLLSYNAYKKLLQRSDLHCYFTRPYVTSWSLFEAASCGAKLCMNKSDATKNIVEKEADVIWVDIDNSNELYLEIKSALEKGAKSSALPEIYEINNCIKKWINLINKNL